MSFEDIKFMRMLLLSPVTEYGCFDKTSYPNFSKQAQMKAVLRMLRTGLEAKGYKVKTCLKYTARIPSNLTSTQVSNLLRSDTWLKESCEKTLKALSNFEAIIITPDCLKISSPYVTYVVKMGKKMGLSFYSVGALLGESESSLLDKILDVELETIKKIKISSTSTTRSARGL